MIKVTVAATDGRIRDYDVEDGTTLSQMHGIANIPRTGCTVVVDGEVPVGDPVLRHEAYLVVVVKQTAAI